MKIYLLFDVIGSSHENIPLRGIFSWEDPITSNKRYIFMGRSNHIKYVIGSSHENITLI
jgi:hypothetical protein